MSVMIDLSCPTQTLNFSAIKTVMTPSIASKYSIGKNKSRPKSKVSRGIKQFNKIVTTHYKQETTARNPKNDKPKVHTYKRRASKAKPSDYHVQTKYSPSRFTNTNITPRFLSESSTKTPVVKNKGLVTPKKTFKAFNYGMRDTGQDSSKNYSYVKNEIPKSMKKNTLENFKKSRKTVQPSSANIRIDMGIKSVVKAKIKEIAGQLENKEIKPTEAMSSMSAVLHSKTDYKVAAELVVHNTTRNTLLHVFASLGHLSLINHFMMKNPKTNIDIMNKLGETPLHIAIKCRHLALIKILIHLGASMRARNFEGKTPNDLLVEQDLSFIVRGNQSEHQKTETVGTSRTGRSSGGVFNINIEETKDELVEDIFSNIRDYFRSEGKLLPKANKESVEIQNSEMWEADFEEHEPSEDDCNVSMSETGSRNIQNLPIMRPKVPEKLFNSGTKQSIEGRTTRPSKIESEESKKSFKAKKVGPDSFKAVKLIGVGSFGEVFLVEKIDTGTLYAMKILKKDRILKGKLAKYAVVERNVLCISSHPFIVKLYYAFQTSDRLFLIMEYCPGGDLGDYLEAEDVFDEDKARFYMAEIITAIEDLHKRGIIYRDLKPDNIVLDKRGHAKLTDFGLSKEGMEKIDYTTKSFCGSYAYLAPEMVKKEGHTMSLDWYLLGVLLFEMLDGFPPYYSEDKDELMANILQDELKIPSHISRNARDLLTKLLEKDPSKRLGNDKGAEELMQHPWFCSINWKDVTRKRLRPYEPYLLKTKEEILLSIGRREKLAIEKSKDYLKKVDEKALTQNKLSGWTYGQSIITENRESYLNP